MQVVSATGVAGGSPHTSGSPLADTVRSTVEQFIQQLRAVGAAGGSVAADPVILSLYTTLNALHPQLLKQIDDVQQHKGVCLWCLWGYISSIFGMRVSTVCRFEREMADLELLVWNVMERIPIRS